MNKILIALVLAVVMGGNAFAKFKSKDDLKTNIDGVIIKNLVCYSSCVGTLVNRNSEPLNNVTINLKLFDKDNDPIGSCETRELINVYGRLTRFNLDANSGREINLSNCNGDKAKSVTITVAPDKILGLGSNY